MDVAIALSVVPVIVGLVVVALRLGLPTLCEAPLAVLLSVAIILSYVLAGPVPDSKVVADALVQGAAVGLTSAGLIATIRRFTLERRASKRRGAP
ncbi:MAG TPA: hypothetical protein VFH48_16385 [Chloroflexota bacterium]|nr:hypothetical protein [Chloroflexota bacterium]